MCHNFVRCKKHGPHCVLSADPVKHYTACRENVFMLSTTSEVAIIIVSMEQLIKTVTECLQHILKHVDNVVCDSSVKGSTGAATVKRVSDQFARSLSLTRAVLTRMLLMKENKSNRKLCSKVAGALYQLGRKHGKTCLKMLRKRRNVALKQIDSLELTVDKLMTTILALLSC